MDVNNVSASNKNLSQKARSKSLIKGMITHAIVVIITIPVIYFFYWLIETSLVNRLTGELTFENWAFFYREIDIESTIVPVIWPVLWFTVQFAIVVTILNVLIATPTAYAFSRLDFPGKRFFMKALFFLNAFPSSTVMIAIFFIAVYLNLANTFWGIVIISTALMLPNQVYILKGFFDDIPWDYEWAALVDGCTRFESFKQVILPSATNGIGVIMIFAFLKAYAEWFLFKILIFSTDYVTLAKLMQSMLMADGEIVNYGVMAALAIFFAIPVAIFYMVSQRQLMKISNLGGKKLA